jgi:hypothetical protein
MFLETVVCDTSRYLYWQIFNLSERKKERSDYYTNYRKYFNSCLNFRLISFLISIHSFIHAFIHYVEGIFIKNNFTFIYFTFL